MTGLSEHTFRCPGCGHEFRVEVRDIINVGENPELKSTVLNGELFMQECPNCGRRHLIRRPLVYLDPEEKLLIMLSDRPVSMSETEGYTARLVSLAGELIEKVKIFDAGLDDKAVEMCKFVTKQDAGKPEMELKFLRLDGADGDLVFAYPSGGEMQMLAVSFSVYEDCRGIIARNPAVAGRARGLCRIDEAWVSSLLR
jgi:predicted RNA-binding Zn-ribbon protein involved in translation (DUF1610 family)